MILRGTIRGPSIPVRSRERSLQRTVKRAMGGSGSACGSTAIVPQGVEWVPRKLAASGSPASALYLADWQTTYVGATAFRPMKRNC